MKLSERAMLVSLTLRKWSARRIDKKVTQEVHSRHGTKSNAGRYNKCLIDPENESFRAIETIDNAIRACHYKMTLPWTQDGLQILSSGQYFDYAEAMGEFSSQREGIVQTFLAEFPALVKQAKRDLNGMFRESDYPNIAQLKARYEFAYTINPMPDSDDFRVALGQANVEVIKQQIANAQERAFREAMSEAWRRLYEPVRHMADTLAREESAKRSKDSLVHNIAEIAALLPKLNLANDERLDAMAREVLASLTQQHPAVVRNDPTVRTEIAARANELANKMAAIMGE